MAENSLISVIVPIYKVEEYLDECVSSIVAQRYHNLEIILVDDGSPDNCPLMCEEWAKRDSRIVVVHKSNGGLSSARNAGLEIAKGDYVSFIDSDDFLEKDTYDVLLAALQRNQQCDIASCMLNKYVDGVVSPYNKNWIPSGDRVVEYDKFAELCLSCAINFTVTSKIFKKNLVENVRFREGRTNEDTLFMFDLSKIIEKERVSMVEVPNHLYYYRMRSDSICNEASNPLTIQVLKNYEEIIDYYKKINSRTYKKTKRFHDSCLVNFLYGISKDKSLKEKYYSGYITYLKEMSLGDILNIGLNKVLIKYFFLRFF